MKILRRIREFLGRRRIEAEMAEQVRLHLEEVERDLVAGGMAAEAARTEARRRFGHVDGMTERCRDERGFPWVEDLIRDLWQAGRGLRREKGFASVVVLTLGLGIGATTAIVSVVDGVVLRPLPMPDAGRLHRVGELMQYPTDPAPIRWGVAPAALADIMARRDFFADLTWSDTYSGIRRGVDFTTSVRGAVVPAGYFSFFGARPALGRDFSPDEARAMFERAAPAATGIILSDAWWRSEFQADPKALGSTIRLGDTPFTVIGVMPAHFQFPSQTTRFWVCGLPRTVPARGTVAPLTDVTVRLKPETSAPQLRALLDSLEMKRAVDPKANRLWTAPLEEVLLSGTDAETIKRTLWSFLAAIGFVLAIACANVANLSLARAERRQGEFAIRAALGAGRGRLARQLLAESALLSCLGGLVGLLVTAWSLRLLLGFSSLPRLKEIGVNGPVLAVAAGLSVAVGALVGVVPALKIGAGDGPTSARAGHWTATPRRSLYRQTLVAGEIALAAVLLTGAALMVESVMRVLRVDPGFRPGNLAAVRVNLADGGFVALNGPAVAARRALAVRIQEQLAALPAVEAAGIAALPEVIGASRVLTIGDHAPMLSSEAYVGTGSFDFFRAAGIRLVDGREFAAADEGAETGAVIVNQAMAKLIWGAERAVGQKFRSSDKDFEVVGVVADSRIFRLDQPAAPLLYHPFSESIGVGVEFILRTRVDPHLLAQPIRGKLRELIPNLQAPAIEIMAERLFESTAAQRTYRDCLLAVAGLGLLLSAIGIYGLLAYAVAQRTREIGIRMAIGADRMCVVKEVMSDGLRIAGVGAVAGLVGSFWLAAIVEKQLIMVGTRDVEARLAAAAVLVVVAFSACLVPALRAARVDPIAALRAD